MDKQTAIQILLQDKNKSDAEIFFAGTQHPFIVQKVVVALDKGNVDASGNLVGNLYKVGFPFKSLFVKASTDTTTTVSIQPDTQDSYQSAVPLVLNDSLDLDSKISGAYLSWQSQPGKSITILFFVSAAFRSGSQLSLSGGGTSISEGSAFTGSQVTLAAAAATSVAIVNGLRKVLTLQNTSGASIWIGGAAVSNAGVNIGIEVVAGANFYWRNSAAFYAYSVGGGLITLLEES